MFPLTIFGSPSSYSSCSCAFPFTSSTDPVLPLLIRSPPVLLFLLHHDFLSLHPPSPVHLRSPSFLTHHLFFFLWPLEQTNGKTWEMSCSCLNRTMHRGDVHTNKVERGKDESGFQMGDWFDAEQLSKHRDISRLALLAYFHRVSSKACQLNGFFQHQRALISSSVGFTWFVLTSCRCVPACVCFCVCNPPSGPACALQCQACWVLSALAVIVFLNFITQL